LESPFPSGSQTSDIYVTPHPYGVHRYEYASGMRRPHPHVVRRAYSTRAGPQKVGIVGCDVTQGGVVGGLPHPGNPQLFVGGSTELGTRSLFVNFFRVHTASNPDGVISSKSAWRGALEGLKVFYLIFVLCVLILNLI